MFSHFRSTLTAHYALLAVLALLVASLGAAWFAYRYVYQPLQAIPTLHLLKSELSPHVLKVDAVQQAHTVWLEKQKRPQPQWNRLTSPFPAVETNPNDSGETPPTQQ